VAKNVGTAKPVDVTAIQLTGTDAGNYTLASTSASTVATVTQRPLRIDGLTGVSATDRVYDGTTLVNVAISSVGQLAANPNDLVLGDVVTVPPIAAGSTSGTMADKNVGKAKAVVVSGLSLGGTDAGNYLVAATDGVTVNITPAPVTASYVGLDKAYDGKAAATVVGSLSGVYAIDQGKVDLSPVVGSFVDGKNVGNGKTVDFSGATLSNTESANYSLVNPSGSTSANITPRQLAATYVGGSKVYDGLVAAPVSVSFKGVIAGDDVSLLPSAEFTGSTARNAGQNKPVAIVTATLGGADAGNYSVVNASPSITGSITPKPLRVDGLSGVAATDRNYDGSNQVAISVSSVGPLTVHSGDLVGSDVVTVDPPAAGLAAGTMADPNVGSNKPVVVSAITLSGPDAGNYTVAATAGLSVNIAPAPLTAVYTGVDKVYDGTALASLNSSLPGLFSIDIGKVGVSATAIFRDGKNVGVGKTVDVTMGSLTGGLGAANYTLLNPTDTTTASISARPLTAVYSGTQKVYDGLDTATVSASAADIVAADAGKVVITAQGVFRDGKAAGLAKAVDVSNGMLAGAESGNYQLSNPSGSTIADITRRPLNITGLGGIQAVDRVYDTTRDVQLISSGPLTPTTGDKIAGDDVSVSAAAGSGTAGLMADKNAGLNKPVVVTGLSLSGKDAGNYQITGTAGLTVNIAAAPVSVSGVNAIDRVYDGTVNVAVDAGGASLTGRLGSDVLGLQSSGTGTIADKHVGSAKAVTIDGLRLTGADAGNYVIASGGGTSVNIAPLALLVTAQAADKVYDGKVDAIVALKDDHLAGDALVVSATSSRFADKNAGVGKSVTVSGIGLSGADQGDYLLATDTLQTSATISPAKLGVTAPSATKVYGDSIDLASLGFTASGLVAGETIGQVLLASDGAPVTANVAGSPYAVTASGASGGSFDPTNYDLSYSAGRLTVLPRLLTVVANNAVLYATDPPGKPSLSASHDPHGLVNGDTLDDSKTKVTPASNDFTLAGSVIRLTPTDAKVISSNPGNYTLNYADGLLVVLPRTPLLTDVEASAGGGGNQFYIGDPTVEKNREQAELERIAPLVAQADAPPARTAGSAAAPAVEINAADIAILLSGDARTITLPSLQKLPLISLDPQLRRLIDGPAPTPVRAQDGRP
jgi:hypothetical protein